MSPLNYPDVWKKTMLLVQRPGMRFAIVFSLVTLVFYLLLNTAPQFFFDAVNLWNARAVGFLLTLAGLSPLVKGDLISYGGFTAKVVGECSAVFISVLPLAFFLSYPSGFRTRMAGIFIGLPFLFFANIFRIVLVFLVGWKAPDLFGWVHLYIGQVVMILLVIWICMTWLRWAHRDKTEEFRDWVVFKIFCVSILVFAAWVWLSGPYTRIILHISRIVLETAGYQTILPETLAIYPHTFISFNMVILFSLVLVRRLIRRRVEIFKTALAFSALVILHVLFQILPVLFFQHHVTQSRWMINTLLVMHQFVLPFVFCLVFIPIPNRNRKAEPISSRLTAGTATG